jgi:hypothetical protein
MIIEHGELGSRKSDQIQEETEGKTHEVGE